VTVKLDKKLGLGNLSCKVCGQRFQTGINCEATLFSKNPEILYSPLSSRPLLTEIQSLRPDLSAGVDVYADWIDACDAVAKDNTGDGGRNNSRGKRAIGSPDPSGHGVATSGGAEDEVAYEDEY
jgi:transcription elongation factor Elf1